MASFNDEHTEVKSVSPVTKHAERQGNSEKGFFSYYDKESKENKKIEVKSFIVLKTGYKISGYDEKSNGGIWSNEINSFNDELFVSNKEGIITQGLYKDIKDRVLSRGGNLFKVVTILHEGEIISLSVKGSAFWSLSKILDGYKDDDGNAVKGVNWKKSFIKFNGFEDAKKGAVKYRVPLFVEGDELSKEDIAEASVSASIVDSYYNNKYQKKADDGHAFPEAGADDLPFN